MTADEIPGTNRVSSRKKSSVFLIIVCRVNGDSNGFKNLEPSKEIDRHSWNTEILETLIILDSGPIPEWRKR
jgi:hypothetical protein